MDIGRDSPFVPIPKGSVTRPLAPLDPNAILRLAVDKVPNGTLPPVVYLEGERGFIQLAAGSKEQKPLSFDDVMEIVVEHSPRKGLYRLVESLSVHRNFDEADAILAKCPYLESEIDAPDEDGDTLLLSAISIGDIELVQWLERHGANVSATDGNGRTALMRSMLEVEHADLLSHLLAQTKPLTKRYDINAKDLTGLSALAYAVYFGRMDEVWRLVHNKASMQDTLKEMPLEESVKERLLEAAAGGEDFDDQDIEALKEAIDETLAGKLFACLCAPINKDLLDELDAFYRVSLRVDSLEDRPEAFLKLQQERTCGSFTIGNKNPQASDFQDLESAAGVWDACDKWIRQKALAKEPLTQQDIHSINQFVNQRERPGILRTDADITAGGMSTCMYLPPGCVEEVFNNFYAELISGLEECEASRENPIALAAWAYQALVSIHPYSDANGRTSRIVADYILQRFGLPPMALGNNVEVAVFALQASKSVSPTDCAKIVFAGVKNSYRILGYKV